MRKFLILFFESISFAWDALIKNKLRTLLSLLGISIGIFCIITVLAAVDSLKQNVNADLAEMGNEVVYIGKWPWGMRMDIPWWEIRTRPNPTLNETETLRHRMPESSDMISIYLSTYPYIKINGEHVNNAQMVAISHSFENIETLKITEGRYFSPIESSSGAAVAIIGADIYDDYLGGDISALGKELMYKGQKIRIIGTLEKEGEQMFGIEKDNRIIVPVNFYRKYNIINENSGAQIIVAPNERQKANMEDFLSELRGNMRSIRRLAPDAKDNFELNVPSIIATTFAPLYSMLNMAGFIIGGFSMLVGGFGIANIMFVSVRERTNQIGIQKALGAKNYFILLQFVFESIFLSLTGGIMGILMVWGALSAVQAISDMAFFLSLSNVMVGIGISAGIGFLAGIIPAYMGAKLDPVEAIRSGS
ncbi:MAG: ABC transporter permease [Flavobacteriales bacterium]|nr:ABC transporter permease [Flavobacteriales bacterium]